MLVSLSVSDFLRASKLLRIMKTKNFERQKKRANVMKALKLELADRWLRSKTVVDQGEGGQVCQV